MQIPNLSVLVDAAIGLAIIAAAVVLLSLGKIDSQTGIALIGAGAALASGSSKSALALRVPSPTQHGQPPAHAAAAVVTETVQATPQPAAEVAAAALATPVQA